MRIEQECPSISAALVSAHLPVVDFAYGHQNNQKEANQAEKDGCEAHAHEAHGKETDGKKETGPEEEGSP